MRDRRLVKVWRDLWWHKARTSLVMLAIIVGLTTSGSVLNMWLLLQRVTQDGFRATNPASATIHLDSVDAGLLDAVRRMDGVAIVEPRRTIIGTIVHGDETRSALVFVSPDVAVRRIGMLEREDGAWPSRGTASIDRSSIPYAHVTLGDTVALRIGDQSPITLPVDGVVRDAGLPPGWMDHVVYTFITPATALALGVPAGFDQLQFTVSDRTMSRNAIRQLAERVRATAVALGHRVRAIDVPEPGEHMHAAQMNSLLLTQGAFGVLSLVLSAFLIVNLVSAMLAGQTREIGVMKAIGATTTDLVRMYAMFAILLGVAATLVSVPMAAVIGRAYAEFTGGLLNFDASAYRIPVVSFAVQLLVGLALPLAAAAAPVFRASRRPVAVALRDLGLNERVASVRTSRALLTRYASARPLMLSLRNAWRRRVRTTFTVASLALGGAVFLAALDVRESIRNSVDYMYDTLMRADILLHVDGVPANDTLTALAQSDPDVVISEAWASARASVVRGDELRNAFSMSGVPIASRLLALPLRNGRWLRETDSAALVVSTRLAHDEPALVTGSTVDLLIDGRVQQWNVVGVADAGPTSVAYSTRGMLVNATRTSAATTVAIRTRDRSLAGQSAVVQRLRADLEARGVRVESAQLVQAGRESLEDHLLMVNSFLLVMAELTILVGGLGLASTMSLAVLERVREIGVMSAIGASSRTIMLMLQVEGVVLSLSAWAIAIPLSLPMSLLLSRAFGRILFAVPDVLWPSSAALGAWFALSVVVAVLASGWPARRATQVSAAVSLAYD